MPTTTDTTQIRVYTITIQPTTLLAGLQTKLEFDFLGNSVNPACEITLASTSYQGDGWQVFVHCSMFGQQEACDRLAARLSYLCERLDVSLELSSVTPPFRLPVANLNNPDASIVTLHLDDDLLKRIQILRISTVGELLSMNEKDLQVLTGFGLEQLNRLYRRLQYELDDPD